MVHGNEFRRAPRFKVSMRVQITGIDPVPVLRCGDISASGLYLDFDREVGTIGSMQRLALSTEEGAVSVVVLARVVRIAAIEDFWQGRKVLGVAFQFMFAEAPGISHTRATAEPVDESPMFERFMRALVRSGTSRGLAMQSVRAVAHTPEGEQQAELSDVSPRGMVLDTDHYVPQGERIRVALPGRGQAERWSFEGEVLESVARDGDGSRFRTVVRFPQVAGPDAEQPAEDRVRDDTLEALFDAFTAPAPPENRVGGGRHLAGEISRISLVSVLTLCQLERVTGVLRLERGASRVRCYVRGGELVDVVLEGRDVPPRVVLSEALTWHEGTFDVSFEPVVRSDRLGTPTTPLLIDLAREIDESRRA